MLKDAVIGGDHEKARAALAAGADVEAKDEAGGGGHWGGGRF